MWCACIQAPLPQCIKCIFKFARFLSLGLVFVFALFLSFFVFFLVLTFAPWRGVPPLRADARLVGGAHATSPSPSLLWAAGAAGPCPCLPG